MIQVKGSEMNRLLVHLYHKYSSFLVEIKNLCSLVQRAEHVTDFILEMYMKEFKLGDISDWEHLKQDTHFINFDTLHVYISTGTLHLFIFIFYEKVFYIYIAVTANFEAGWGGISFTVSVIALSDSYRSFPRETQESNVIEVSSSPNQNANINIHIYRVGTLSQVPCLHCVVSYAFVM